MKAASGLKAWAVMGALGAAALAGTAAQLAPIAHSAQLILEAGTTPDALVLRVRPAGAATAPLGVSELQVSLDGKPMSTSHGDHDLIIVPLAKESAHQGKLDVVVTHDGIREILSGSVALPATAPAAGGGLGVRAIHKQIAWWILNIAVVLIGAIVISRRMS